MNQISLLAELEFQQRNQEILKDAARYHLMNEAMKARVSGEAKKSRLLAWVGKQLRSLGHALEERYGEPLVNHPVHYTQNSQSDCA
jgi:hypothetical protein